MTDQDYQLFEQRQRVREEQGLPVDPIAAFRKGAYSGKIKKRASSFKG